MKSLKTYLILVSAALVAYLVAVYNRPEAVNWTVTLQRKHTIPFGTYVLHQQLSSTFSADGFITIRKPAYNFLSDNKPAEGNYLIIASELSEFDKNDFAKLRSFAAAGNTVLIAAFGFGKTLGDSLKLEVSPAYTKYNNGLATFTNPRLKPEKPFKFDKGIAGQYFSSFDTARAIVLGTNGHTSANLLYYPVKKGGIVLCPNPQVFSNYSLLKTGFRGYAEGILSYLDPDKQLIFDEYYLLGRSGNESPLRVLMQYPQLKWAYYLSLITLIVYILYGIKRRQRIIPVIEPLQNTSLDFANVIGQVYYQQKDHQNLALKKFSYLWEHVRSRYRVSTALMDDEFAEIVSKKSGAEKTLITRLARQSGSLQHNQRITPQQLTGINKDIEEFYKQTQ